VDLSSALNRDKPVYIRAATTNAMTIGTSKLFISPPLLDIAVRGDFLISTRLGVDQGVFGTGWTSNRVRLEGEIPTMDEITFKVFQTLMLKRGRTVDDLVEIFRGKIEDPREFFDRVMSCRYHGEDRGFVVIPYRSVMEFYRRDCHFYKDINPKHRACTCGCGRPVFDWQKWASSGCRKRAQREQSVTEILAPACS
jgi:hypothetical protein